MLISAFAALATMSAVAVKVELTVSPMGTATNCAVLESNAPPELDEATCRVSMRKTREPVRDATGTPIESKTVVTVRYQIPPRNTVG